MQEKEKEKEEEEEREKEEKKEEEKKEEETRRKLRVSSFIYHVSTIVSVCFGVAAFSRASRIAYPSGSLTKTLSWQS